MKTLPELIAHYESQLEKVKGAHPGWKGEGHVRTAQNELDIVKSAESAEAAMTALKAFWAPTVTVRVDLTFSGNADVQVPAHFTEEQRHAYATAVAVSRVLATFNNPDGGEAEQDALTETADGCGVPEAELEPHWDASVRKLHELFGSWDSSGARTLES
jgi:hypothetical protein